MEGPLLTNKREHIVYITTHGESSITEHGWVWVLVEFVVTLIQIIAAIYLLPLTKDEQHPDLEEIWYIWIIGYICASIATLPILCWRLWDCSETSEAIDFVEKKLLAYFFVGWIVFFLWVFLTELSSCLDTTQHFWLWMALLFFSCIRYVLPNLEFAVKVFIWPIEYCLEQISEFFIKIFHGIGVICGCIDDDDD
ncbi:hypothetical protein CARUB_v10012391mg [Capsella rubella]|uniref:Transmembrane protein n=1 Tax=Capsella rubella TaxID=81985 RepID=R0IIK8_9BRAS|nr:uncharacterized protein LOC17898167 [Capsella rubella]EOA36723.1 hypothetical protein CARUB_v10012391mg [Capsella rubella]